MGYSSIWPMAICSPSSSPRWKTAGKKPVKNPDLWKRLLKAKEPHDVRFVWVKGHAGHTFNERCDQLATTAADNGPLYTDEGFTASDLD